MAFHRVAFVQGFLSKIMRILMAEFMFWHLSSPVHVVMNLMKLCSNWLKSVKNPMGYSWDWFKSPEPMGHPLEHFMSLYSWLKLLWRYVLPLGPFQVEYAPVVSHHQSKCLPITKSFPRMTWNDPMSNTLHYLSHLRVHPCCLTLSEKVPA